MTLREQFEKETGWLDRNRDSNPYERDYLKWLEQRLETASAVDTIVSSAEWICVEDRLPEKSGFYLISNGVFVKRGEYNTLYGKWFAPTEVSGVTHWSLLPEPPNV